MSRLSFFLYRRLILVVSQHPRSCASWLVITEFPFSTFIPHLSPLSWRRVRPSKTSPQGLSQAEEQGSRVVRGGLQAPYAGTAGAQCGASSLWESRIMMNNISITVLSGLCNMWGSFKYVCALGGRGEARKRKQRKPAGWANGDRNCQTISLLSSSSSPSTSFSAFSSIFFEFADIPFRCWRMYSKGGHRLNADHSIRPVNG